MTEQRPRKAQIVLAPSRPALTGRASVFLAGTTSKGAGPDWRETMTEALSHLPVTILNPLRPDWDSSWKEDPAFPPFRDQVLWELDMQERADVVAFYFGPATDAPISLLELGLAARPRKAVVLCHPAYRKKGNVQLVCHRFGLEVVGSEAALAAAVIKRLGPRLRPTVQAGAAGNTTRGMASNGAGAIGK